jgi:DNA-binding response OmpR family regulator
MSPLKILLVEDDPNDVALFQVAIKQKRIKASVQPVPDGKQAIQFLKGEGPYADRKAYPVPDLVVLDLKLPLVGGLEVLEWRKVSGSSSSIPFVVFTGSPQEMVKSLNHGADRIFLKPMSMNEIKARVAEICELGLQWRQAPGERPA